MRHLRPGHVASAHRRHAKGHPDEVVIKRSRGKVYNVVRECIRLSKLKYIYFFELYIYCFVQNIFVLVYEKYISSKCICACMSIAKKMQSYHLRQIVSHESIKWKTLFFGLLKGATSSTGACSVATRATC